MTEDWEPVRHEHTGLSRKITVTHTTAKGAPCLSLPFCSLLLHWASAVPACLASCLPKAKSLVTVPMPELSIHETPKSLPSLWETSINTARCPGQPLIYTGICKIGQKWYGDNRTIEDQNLAMVDYTVDHASSVGVLPWHDLFPNFYCSTIHL